MTSKTENHGQDHSDRVISYALRAVAAGEASLAENQISECADCRRELATLRPLVVTFGTWPTSTLEPSGSLWDRLARRIADETGAEPAPSFPSEWAEPEWAEVAPGISVKMLATDVERDRVSMLVRLGPGVDYPRHRHAGIEELHLLDGELVIDEKTLYPGDYVKALPGTSDKRVWSETGCTCVLITSPSDALG